MICRSDFPLPLALRLFVAIPLLLLVTALPAAAQTDRQISADQVAQVRAELRAVHEQLARMESMIAEIRDRLNRGPRPVIGPPRRDAPLDRPRRDLERGDLERGEQRRIEIRRDREPAERIERERRDLDRERAQRERERDRDEAQMHRREELEREMHELERLAAQGDSDEARRARGELQEVRKLLQREHHAQNIRRHSDSPDRLHVEIRELEGEMQRLAREGHHDEAHGVRARIEELVEELHQRERRGREGEERRDVPQREDRERDQHRQHQQEVEELRALVERLKHELESVREERNR